MFIRNILSLWVMCLGAPLALGGEGADLQRLQQLRDHQQMELRLKMQQQQGRALNPAPPGAADLQRRHLEHTQQRHQQQRHDEQSRASIVPNRALDESSQEATASLENERAAQRRRYELERRIEDERNGRTAPGGAAGY